MDSSADVLIIGSGVAGALLACELAGKGGSVAIMEAGPRVDRAEAVRRFHAAYPKTPESAYRQSPFTPHPMTEDPRGFYAQKGADVFNSTYLRQVGGTTWHWLGTAIRLVPDDFRLNSLFGLATDWPISYDDLEPWYCRAKRELEVSGDAAEDLGSPRSAPYPLPPVPQSFLDRRWKQALSGSKFDLRSTPQARRSKGSSSRPSCHGSASCIPVCPIQAKYDATVHIARAEMLGARLLTQTCANFIECHEDGRVAAVRFRRPDVLMRRNRCGLQPNNLARLAHRNPLRWHGSLPRLPRKRPDQANGGARHCMKSPGRDHSVTGGGIISESGGAIIP